jgi:uncharacterized protein (TIGR03083 family)
VFTDLVLHLGSVQRMVARFVSERRQSPPEAADRSGLGLPAELTGWLPPGKAPSTAAVPAELIDWFAVGATALAAAFAAADPGENVWTWWSDHTVGFWQRMQAIEAAVHRWDAQFAIGPPDPIEAALAADAVSQTFEILVPARRALAQAPPGRGERFRFCRSDGEHVWAVRFDEEGIHAADPAEAADVEVSAAASDLALFLWQRIGAERLNVTGAASLLDRYFELVPPQ